MRASFPPCPLGKKSRQERGTKAAASCNSATVMNHRMDAKGISQRNLAPPSGEVLFLQVRNACAVLTFSFVYF